MSNLYTSGTINIPNVTGNIVITAVATPGVVTSISAVFTQGSAVIYDTDSLDTLRQYLTVTATYSTETSAVVTTYTLSGTLTAGTSTITVAYGGQTDTFSVTVTHYEMSYLYNWDLTNSLVDTVEQQEITLYTGENTSASTRDSNGLHFNQATQVAYLGAIPLIGRTVEIDVSSFEFAGDSSSHVRFFMHANINPAVTWGKTMYGNGALIYKSNTGWSSYGFTTSTGSSRGWSSLYNSDLGINAFNGKTVKIVFGSDGLTKHLYLDNVLVGSLASVYFNNTVDDDDDIGSYLFIGGIYSSTNNGAPTQSKGDQCYNMTITGVRIYENV